MLRTQIGHLKEGEIQKASAGTAMEERGKRANAEVRIQIKIEIREYRWDFKYG